MDRSRIYWTLLALLALAAAGSGFVDRHGEHYADEALERAFVTWAVARALNGVISVAQGTEVAVEPGGVGVNFGVGQILDPVNDLVEQFSTVMLIATASLTLQDVMLKIGSWWGSTLLLCVAAVLALLCLWRPVWFSQRQISLAVRFLLLSVLVRFAVPLLLIGSNMVFDTFLAEEQQAATAALESTTEQVRDLSDEPEPSIVEDQSLLERLGSKIDETVSALQVGERLQAFKDAMANASKHVVNLIVIFVLQTILLPLIFLWVLLELLKALLARAATSSS